MKKQILAALIISGSSFAFANDDSVEKSEDHNKVIRSFQIYTTWAETGLAATGIASSDFLHNQVTKPATRPLIGFGAPAETVEPSRTAQGRTTEPETETEVVEVADAPAPLMKDDSVTDEPEMMRTDSSASPAPTKPAPTPMAPSRSMSGGKTVVTEGGKQVVTETDVVYTEPAPQLEFSIDGGYQSRYFYLGLNQIENASFLADADDTAMVYGGISANWNGFGLGVRYVRGTEDLETFHSIDPIIVEEYEEWVFDISYSFNVLPDNWLSITAGYQALYFPEETWWNTDRQDDWYVRLGNSVFPLLRPSVTYHYLDQGGALGAGENTFLPGVERLTGELIIVQVDGQLGIPDRRNLPLDLVYYAQVGFDNEYNAHEDFDQDWWQVGLALPIYIRNLTVTPNWHYNERDNDNEQHFWGINVRLDF